MNRLIFNQTGGFPLKGERLQELQEAFEIFNAIGAIAGNKSIITGCKVNGTQTGNGVVYYDGEMLEFVGSTTQDKVILIQEEKKREYFNGEQKPVHYRRYITFGTGPGAMDWSDFKDAGSLLELKGRILPPGTNPQLYCGSIEDIPNGWQLCDGSNETPDLRSRFIVGYDPRDADYGTIGNKGGEKKHSLSEAEMPSHNHTGSVYIPPHRHELPNTVYSNEGGGVNAGDKLSHDGNIYAREVTRTDLASSQTVNFTTSTKGSGQAHENRPPYYTLAYIIYKG